LIQNASDTRTGTLVFFVFDLLFSDGEDLMALPLIDRKARLAKLLAGAPPSLIYNDHQISRGPAFHRLACERGLEGIVSKRINGRYEPDRRWCLAGSIGCSPKWASRLAMSNGRRTVCSGMLSAWASARNRRPS